MVDAGHSAQTVVIDLAALAEESPGTEILWTMRRQRAAWQVTEHDPLPRRAKLIREAQALAQGASGHVSCQTGVVLDSVEDEQTRSLPCFSPNSARNDRSGQRLPGRAEVPMARGQAASLPPLGGNCSRRLSAKA